MSSLPYEQTSRDAETAHARIDALQRHLDNLAQSVTAFATETRQAFSHLSDKMSQVGRTDWRVVVSAVAVVITVFALAGALIMRTVESSFLQLEAKVESNSEKISKGNEWQRLLFEESMTNIRRELDLVHARDDRAEAERDEHIKGSPR